MPPAPASALFYLAAGGGAAPPYAPADTTTRYCDCLMHVRTWLRKKDQARPPAQRVPPDAPMKPYGICVRSVLRRGGRPPGCAGDYLFESYPTEDLLEYALERASLRRAPLQLSAEARAMDRAALLRDIKAHRAATQAARAAKVEGRLG